MAKRKAPEEKRSQELDPSSEAWNKIPWRKLEKYCFRMQKRIYQASQRGNTRAVRWCELTFREGDLIEIDHIDGNHANDEPSNLGALHRHFDDERHTKPREEWKYATGINHT